MHPFAGAFHHKECCDRQIRLFRVPFGQFGGHRRQVSEETTGSVIGSRGEVHLGSRRGRRIGIGWAHIPRTKRPDAIDGERLSACILQQSFEMPRGEVVCSDESTGISGSASRKTAR